MNPPEERSEIDSVVICTDDDTPIVAALRVGNNVWVKTIEDSEFTSIMKTLGLEKRVVPVTKLEVS